MYHYCIILYWCNNLVFDHCACTLLEKIADSVSMPFFSCHMERCVAILKSNWWRIFSLWHWLYTLFNRSSFAPASTSISTISMYECFAALCNAVSWFYDEEKKKIIATPLQRNIICKESLTMPWVLTLAFHFKRCLKMPMSSLLAAVMSGVYPFFRK